MKDLQTYRINGCLIRPAYLYPGGPVVGYIVTKGRLLLVKCGSAGGAGGFGGVEAALESAIRFAKRRPTRRDEGRAVTWRYEDDNEYITAARPDWLAFVRGTAVLARYRRSDDSMVFHAKCGLAPRPIRRQVYR